MKNPVKPIDISIISEYLGRFQTVIVALLVIAIAAHAFVTRNAARGHVPLTLAVPSDGGRFEPLARIIARRSARTVELAVNEWTDSAELFVLPPHEFFRRRGSLGLKALFTLSERPADRALIVSRRSDTAVPDDAAAVLFSTPESVNGCWVQLYSLSRRKARVPASLDSLQFAGGKDAGRVVWAVVNGLARFGACRASDLDETDADRVRVVFQTPALPDYIVAARADDEAYFLDRLDGLGLLFEAPGEEDHDAVALLRERGIGAVREVSKAQLEELSSVCEFMGKVAEGGNP
jgi:hypothetical protein